MLNTFINLMERGWLPDWMIRGGVRKLLAKRLRDLHGQNLESYALGLEGEGLAFATKEANRQHYEVPTEFYRDVLGQHLKYSCSYFTTGESSLDRAELAALSITCERAELRDGLKVLELGCGWGSLSLFMAERYPQSEFTAVSNSATQKQFIDAQAAARGIKNLNVLTLDLSKESSAEKLPEQTFDRVVSIEMFEHFRNYARLLRQVCAWLKPQGKLFVHIFTHRQFAYPFEVEGDDNWMGKYFFTGGQMPARDLLPRFHDALKLEQIWDWNGQHYAKTAEAWLENMDAKKTQVMAIFEKTYGVDARLWFNRWRVFFISCAELFGYAGGTEWAVTHYLFTKPPA